MSEGGYRTGPAHRGPSAIRLVWVYPDLLSTYGDRGNLLVLARRARLRGFGVEIAEVNSDQRVPVDGDIYLLGGGEDLPQILAARRLAAGGPRASLAAAAARGAVVFAVCAGYQIVGTEFGGGKASRSRGSGCWTSAVAGGSGGASARSSRTSIRRSAPASSPASRTTRA